MKSPAATNRKSSHQQWTMGASPQCDVWVNAPSVSGTHCRFETSANRDSRSVQLIVEDLGSTNGTFVRNQRIDAPVVIDPTTAVTLGSQQPLPWPTPIGAKQVVTFGASDDNDLVIHQPGVSSSHGRLIIGPMQTLVVEDLQSTNGIRVADSKNEPSHRILQAALVQKTDTLLLGSTPLQVAALLAVKQVKRSVPGKSPGSPAEPRSPTKSKIPRTSNTSPSASPSPGLQSPVSRSQGGAINDRRQLGILAGVVVAVLFVGVGVWFLLRDPTSLAHNQNSDSTTNQKEGAENQFESAVISGSPAKVRSGRGPSSAASSGEEAWSYLADPNQAALFHVLVQTDDGLSSFRVGTAWAINDQRLLTTAMVVKAMEIQQKEAFPNAVAVHAATGELYPISRVRKHPSLESELAKSIRAVNEFDAAKAVSPPPSDLAKDAAAAVTERGKILKQLAEKMLRTRTAFAAYDIASVQLNSPLPSRIPKLKIATGAVLRPKQKLTLLAAPFDAEDPFYDSSLPVTFENTTWTVEGIERVNASNGGSELPRLILSGPPKPPFAGDGIRWNRFGSPLVDAAGRVMTVFSTPTTTSQDISKTTSNVMVEGPSAASFNSVSN
ncbi:FHA domain-containing protein [Rhodopirellula sallentina]|uniref:FHA domain protein n=1 Tax=Rhodopirellula sallentina SM41 TaxID=1263870 RepID=M5UPJ1_9BACT|nr:FHA domain-containing protein [Rhodopirellula sallentina]EMI57923.1 FHA domain protein [Rhodopirellula sallentina SM41]